MSRWINPSVQLRHQVWEDSDLVSIGELQLLWEDRSTNQTLGSLRLYYLPEYTQEGRLPEHGEVGITKPNDF